jgi:hypothetical protein
MSVALLHMALTSVIACKFLIVRCFLLGPRQEIEQTHLYIIFSLEMQNIIMNNKYINYRPTYSTDFLYSMSRGF